MTEERTNIQMDEQKDENYIPFGINDGSIIKAEVAKFDLAVKYVKINTGLSFEYNELEFLMLHTKFHRNRPTGSWKQDFLSIYTIYGHGSHLGHVTSIMLINFHFLVPQKLHTKFG